MTESEQGLTEIVALHPDKIASFFPHPSPLSYTVGVDHKKSCSTRTTP